jgi:hypothetical protein
MSEKRIFLLGVGEIIGMIKFYLVENGERNLVEILPDCCDDLIQVIERERPDTVILEKSPKTRPFQEALLQLAARNQFKLVEIFPNDNRIHVVDCRQYELDDARDFLSII